MEFANYEKIPIDIENKVSTGCMAARVGSNDTIIEILNCDATISNVICKIKGINSLFISLGDSRKDIGVLTKSATSMEPWDTFSKFQFLIYFKHKYE